MTNRKNNTASASSFTLNTSPEVQALQEIRNISGDMLLFIKDMVTLEAQERRGDLNLAKEVVTNAAALYLQREAEMRREASENGKWVVTYVTNYITALANLGLSNKKAEEDQQLKRLEMTQQHEQAMAKIEIAKMQAESKMLREERKSWRKRANLRSILTVPTKDEKATQNPYDIA